MPTMVVVVLGMHNREELIDELLERITENPDVLSVVVSAYSPVWVAKIEMANPTVFAVELALSYDGLFVEVRD